MPVITSKHDGVCRSCGKPISKGTTVSWIKRRGIRHYPHCPSDDASSNAQASPRNDPKLPPIKNALVANVDWPEVRAVYRRATAGDFSDFTGWNLAKIPEFASRHWLTREHWSGATNEQMLDWLARGYAVDISPVDDLIPERERRKIIYGDEGELQLDLAWSGFDYPFSQWEKRQSKPGMSLIVGHNARANVSAQTLKEYAHFVAQVTETLEVSGYDLEILIRSRVRNQYRDYTGEAHVQIRVKSENETTDMVDWSALFSPGGFRHLNWCSRFVAAEKLGQRIDTGMGNPISRSWSVSFDEESRVMTIECDPNSNSFPLEEMRKQFREALDIASK